MKAGKFLKEKTVRGKVSQEPPRIRSSILSATLIIHIIALLNEIAVAPGIDLQE